MAKPIIAVVGRPNVGKSTLFNKIIGKRLSIVDDTPGVTRDRIYGDAEWQGQKLMLVDTGGIEPKTDDIILSSMRAQAQLAIDTAAVIIFVTDIKTGVTAADQEVAAMLQKSGKPIVLCVNKCDGIGDIPMEFYEFYNLGLGDPIAVSSVHGHGTGDLLDAVMSNITPEDFQDDEEDIINVLNSFLGETEQIPSIYSAIKINGKKLYEYAREGEEINIPTRKIFIKRITHLNMK